MGLDDLIYSEHLAWTALERAKDERNPYKHTRKFIECPQCHFIDTYFVDQPIQCRSCKNKLE